ncbi:hypothetical protein [Melittangium boletus]|uniref:Uncharacterized protein n=1 Tax=Melittangium boletus DSM 14713 TaxID=1294270 RepID=A0A250ISH6_9BACT|nr:hypothetical protein [Melittangium boletus]ATB34208.1 hypothetical protein MEBOL_007709 [Melittangium boletus DSM 14713]
MNVRGLFLVIALGTTPVLASPATGPARQVLHAVLQIPDSLRVRMLAALARGDLAGAISLWELETGKNAPQWLLAFQAAFNTTNQRAGPCIQVARDVFEGFKQLGMKPSYVRFSTTVTEWGDDFIAFERRAGEPRSAVQISNNALHFAVQIENRIYDAMTGPTGLIVTDYLKRIHSPASGGISMQLVEQLP